MAVTTRRKRGRKKRVDIDIVIGRNLCALRQTAGLSQPALAEQLDMSYRQVQKYEQGMDRIASSTLPRRDFSKPASPLKKPHKTSAAHRSEL